MRYCFVAALGIFWVSYWPRLPQTAELCAIGLVFLLSVYRRWLILAVFFLGVLYSCMYGHYRLYYQLPHILDHQVVPLEVEVLGLPKRSTRSTQFLVSATLLNNDEDIPAITGRMQLSWYKAPELMPGDRWALSVKVKRLRGLVNPFVRDYQGYLFAKNIIATGQVKGEGEKLNETSCRYFMISCWRYSVKQLLLTHLSPSTAGLAIALTVGDKSEIGAEHMHLLKETGTIHLLAISGLHIGLIAWLGFHIGLFILRLFQRYKPLSTHVTFAYVLSITMAIVYSLMAGFTLPTQRALIMIAVFYFSRCMYRQPPIGLSLAIALVFVAILDPLAATQPGFWMSFVAVAVLLWGFNGWRQSQNYWVNALKSQWVVFVGLFIPSIWLLGGISLSAPLANSIAITAVSLILLPLLLLFVAISIVIPSAAGLLLGLVDTLLYTLISFLQIVDVYIPGFSYRAFAQPSLLTVLLVFLAITLILSPLPRHYKWLAALCLIPIGLPDTERYPFAIHFLDVGQGTAIVIESGAQVAVYDTGPPIGEHSNATEQVLAPFLRARGYNLIDVLWVSHSDSDHSSGLRALAQQFLIAQLSEGEPDSHKFEQARLGYPCMQGQTYEWANVSFEVMWPPVLNRRLPHYPIPHYLFADPLESNNFSCTVLIKAFGKQILLTGDIERRAEIALIVDNLIEAPIDVLLVPHHGSKTSSTDAFIDYLQPTEAIVTAGYKSRYGHPHPDIIDRYHKRGIDVHNTAITGALTLWVDEKGNWHKRNAATTERRYWHDDER